MKTYAYIILLLVSCYVLSGCRSNRSLSEVSERDTELHITEDTTSSKESSTTTNTTNKTNKDSTKESTSTSTSDQEKSSSENEYEEENKRKFEYYPDGSIKSIEDSSRRRGRTNETNERAGSSNASNLSDNSSEESETNIESQTDETDKTQTNIELSGHESEDINKNEDTSSDSRWIQGWEWLMVIVPIAIVCGAIYLIRNGRKKSNSDRSN